MERLPIDSMTETIEPELYKKSGKDVIVAFDKSFGSKNSDLNKFAITKSAYSKNLDLLCRYANCFFQQYDPDHEFLSGLLSIKFMIDNSEIAFGPAQFESDIHEQLFTDSVIEKINQMAKDYYVIDLSPSAEVQGLDLHALQFLDEHGISLMALSIACKLTIPLICHYYYVNGAKLAEAAKARNESEPTIKKFLYRIFTGYFPYFQGDSEIFNKIAATVNNHLMQTRTSDKALWGRAENREHATTPTVYADELIESVIVDLIPKAMFSGNIIFLFHAAINNQIHTCLLGKDKFEVSEISMMSKSDEPSGLEKLEANKARTSDLDIVLAGLSVKDNVKRLTKKWNITIDEKELEYYKTHLEKFIFSDVVNLFFSKYFDGNKDLRSLSKHQYLIFMIIFKKKMEKMGYVYINQILTGNPSKTHTRRKISNKQLEKIAMSPKFKEAMGSMYSMAMDPIDNPIIKNIAMIINTPMEYCDYNHPERFGEIIVPDTEIIVDEYMRFLHLL